MKKIISYVLCVLFSVNTCGNIENSSEKTALFKAEDQNIASLKIPDKVISLPDELKEISDISYLDNGTIAAIQDEEGAIYIINSSNGDIISKHKFAGNADFEGLAISGNTGYAVTSNGVVYIIKDYRKASPEVSKFSTNLTEFNNVEGLYHDKEKKLLLLLCKNAPGKGLDEKLFKAVYAFDLNTNKIQEDIYLKISLEKIKDFLNKKEKNAIEKFKFNPSAITVHPLKKTCFIIASSGKLLVEMDFSGNIIDVKKLDKNVFMQPEGIAFDNMEGMYISNEGDVEMKGNIMLFKK